MFGKLKEAFPVAREKVVYTEEQKAAVLDKVPTLGIHRAAQEAGIPWQTVTRWIKGENYGKPVRKAEGKAAPASRGTKAGAKGKAGRKPAAKAEKASAKKAEAPEVTTKLIIQSPFGHEISPDEILARCEEADSVCVRVDQNRLYWTKGKKTGWVEIWSKE